MRPLYRAWLYFVAWLGGMALWLFYNKGTALWWQPLAICAICVSLFIVTERRGCPPGGLQLVSVLVLLGWVFLFRLDSGWAARQFWGFVVGAGAYLLGLLLPWLHPRFGQLAAVAALTLLVLALVFGTRISGARAWLTVFDTFTFQPVEFARILLIIYLGGELAQNRLNVKSAAVLGLFLLLLALQTDLGPALLVFLVFSALYFTISFSWLKLVLFLGLGTAAAAAAVWKFPHLRTRLLAWLTPWDFMDSKGYQVLQGIFALNAGGLVGRGMGEGMADVIPAAHTDYILAVIGEEFGLLGTFALLLVYVGLAFWAFRLLLEVGDGRLRLIGLGFTLLLHVQVLLVVGGILRLIPFTGMTLPFVSYGSSSLTAQLWMFGMLTRLGREQL